MTTVLESWVQGRWARGEGRLAPLHNPATEEVLARAGTGGIDFDAALIYGREVGGPNLRALTFAERGAILLAMSKALHARREELVELAIRNGGNTRGDAKFDIDGATGTLAWYGKLGETLGNKHVLLDGSQEALARNPRYVGQHIKVSRKGVAVHINAYNFPAWGFAEKAAVALLAGVPVVTKPATSTALVAERCVRILVDGGVLPEGALQLLCGSVGDVLDHLWPQDCLAFTGSSFTGLKLRSKERLLMMGVRVNVEADSLNAAVLGPDVEPGSDTWDMFLRETVKDMSQKAGQKCTAIRRVIVPRHLLDAAVADLEERVRSLRLGDPAEDGVDVGPVCTAEQRSDVVAGTRRLLAVARSVVGEGGRGNPKGAGERGYFVEPTLLLAPDPHVPEVHTDEVFGPVQTIVPYGGSADEAANVVGSGQGSLVSSLYSDDEAWASAAALGMAPWCGRLHIGSAKVADHSPGPGTVLPQMTHGGPGRAGAGEELGGSRGLDFYLQRTAVQGLKTWVERMG